MIQEEADGSGIKGKIIAHEIELAGCRYMERDSDSTEHVQKEQKLRWYVHSVSCTSSLSSSQDRHRRLVGHFFRLDVLQILPRRVRVRLVKSTKDVGLVNLSEPRRGVQLVDERPERKGDGEA
jgi:hypothetical protein